MATKHTLRFNQAIGIPIHFVVRGFMLLAHKKPADHASPLAITDELEQRVSESSHLTGRVATCSRVSQSKKQLEGASPS